MSILQQHGIPLTGRIYGVILNDTRSMETIGSLENAPYNGAPKAPALYIKPANTIAACGTAITLPDGEHHVEIAATVGLVIGQDVSHLTTDTAQQAIAGIILAADLSLPHTRYYRPAIREKCFDGALPLGCIKSLNDPGRLILTTEINGEAADEFPLTDLIRPPAELLAAVTEFMTLSQGDVLLVGIRYQAPQASPGSQVTIRASGLDTLTFSITSGAEA